MAIAKSTLAAETEAPTKPATATATAVKAAAAVERQYKNPMEVRLAKAIASTVCRHRQRWLVANPTLSEADLPEELRKKSPVNRGRRTIDETGMSPADLLKLERTRESKKEASRVCKLRQKFYAENGPDATLPEELRLKPKGKQSSTAEPLAGDEIELKQMKARWTDEADGSAVYLAVHDTPKGLVLYKKVTPTDNTGGRIVKTPLEDLPATYGEWWGIVNKA